ncbi:MAG TPA: efflux RND transporter permease subunit [Burkholderiaceae bacterium]|nr:efflux RND transporter permease subunit [Burkholderiaceae bacterium]
MLSRIVGFSVQRPGLVVALAGAVVVLGIARLFDASLDVFPEFSPAQVVVQTEAPGRTAAQVETLVTQPIEQAVAGLADLISLRSQSIAGLSVATMIFDDRSSIHRDRQAVAERIAQAVPRLPEGVVPELTPLTSSASTVLGLGLTSTTLDGMALRTLVDTQLRPQLLAVPGVADVNVFGGEVRQWQVQADTDALARFGWTLADLASALRRTSGQPAAGYIETANQRIGISLVPPPANVDSLAQAVVGEHASRIVRVGDVARVVQGGAPRINAAQIDGKPGVFMLVQGQLGANTRDVTQSLEASLAKLKPLIERQGAQLHPALFRPADFIDTAVGNVNRDVLAGAALVVVVLFAFLYNVRTAVVSAVAIPLSLLTAVLVLQRLGFTLNIMVLGGLAIALGEVVDDAIIDCENIYRRLRENRTLSEPRPAARVVYEASLEVRSSVVYATFIVALVFMPLLTLGGVAGKLFAPLGLAYVIAILASLVVALTVTPALALLLLAGSRLPPTDPPLIRWLDPHYRRALLAIERHSGAVFTIVGAGMIVGLAVLPLFEGEFIPPLKEGHFILHMTALPGTSMDESLRLGREVTASLRKIDGVRSVAQWVGRAQNGADTFGSHYSELEIEIGQLAGAEQRRILREMQATLDNGFAGLQFAVNTFLTERIGETVSGFPADLVVNLYGTDLDALDADAGAATRAIAKLRGARDVQLLAPPGAPELAVRLRGERLSAYGLAAGDVMQAVQIAYEGAVVARAGDDAARTPIAVLLPPSLRRDPTQLAALPVGTVQGRTVRLGEVADVAVTDGRYKLLHDGARRVQTITANVERGRDPEVFLAQAEQRVARLKLAPGTHVELTGAGQAQARARRELIGTALVACVGVAALLWLAFGSLRHLALTFVNMPFALVGGVAAVLAGGGVISVGAVVGFVTLFGITLRNSIMLVSHYQHLVAVERMDWNLDTALRGARERLPSILMTALVTALGLAPLALGAAEPGREIEGPMAIIIVGGLVSSTLLNLLVLPAALLRFGRFTTPPPLTR